MLGLANRTTLRLRSWSLRYLTGQFSQDNSTSTKKDILLDVSFCGRAEWFRCKYILVKYLALLDVK